MTQQACLALYPPPPFLWNKADKTADKTCPGYLEWNVDTKNSLKGRRERDYFDNN